MTLRFIHTADWQLGKSFGGLPSDLAGELQAARLDLIARLATLSRSKGAAHVLVAGDVFDHERLDKIFLHRALESMNREASVTWLLLAGNHDCARAGGIWERIASIGLPPNVLPLLTPEPFSLSANASLLPAPLTSKNPGRDPTEWMDQAATPPGVVRVGLAHGSVQGFDSEGESSVMIARDRAKSAGLNYLALGDWHGVKRIDDRCWYSGTPEPDRFPNNEPGFALSVTIEGAGLPQVEKIKTGAFTWVKSVATLRDENALPQIEDGIVRQSDAPNRMLCRLSLDGSLSLSGHATLEAWRERVSGKLRHLEIDSGRLLVTPEAQDFETLGSSGPIAEAARTLDAIARDKENPEHVAAALALVRLFGFAHEAREAGS